MTNLVKNVAILLLGMTLGSVGTHIHLGGSRTSISQAAGNEWDSEVNQILRKFVLEADARAVKLRFGLSDIEIVPDMDGFGGGDQTKAQPIAYCTPGNNQIKINNIYWDMMNDVAKEQVLFHELGHCMLQRDHREDTHPDGRKKSIMSARKRWVKNDTYVVHRKEYLDELFDPARRGDLRGK